jgi:hypothetical protein
MVLVEVDDPVLTVKKCARGADAYTGSVFAVVAAQNGEVAPHIRKGSLLDVLNPGAKVPQRNLVFCFAGDRAGVASDAAPIINDEAIVHDFNPKS